MKIDTGNLPKKNTKTSIDWLVGEAGKPGLDRSDLAFGSDDFSAILCYQRQDGRGSQRVEVGPIFCRLELGQ